MVAGIPDFAGVVGDLGGGSLELSAIAWSGTESVGETHELGVIRLQDDVGAVAQARRGDRARTAGQKSKLARGMAGRRSSAPSVAPGVRWPSCIKMLRGYPLHMVQHYVAKAARLVEFCEDIVAASRTNKAYAWLRAASSSSRRDLVPFGAAVLTEVLRAGQVR